MSPLGYTKLRANLKILNLQRRSAIEITISKPSLMLSISVQNYIRLFDQVSGSNKFGPMKAAFTPLLHQSITRMYYNLMNFPRDKRIT